MQVGHLQTIWSSLKSAGYGDVRILVINYAQVASDAMLLGRFTTLPVLQDTAAAGVWSRLQAGKDTTLVLDANGYVRKRWSFIDLGTSGQELADEVLAARGG